VPGRHLGHYQRAFKHRPLQRLILRRVEDVDPARDHAHRAFVQRPGMSRRIDPAGEPRHHRDPLARQLMGQAASEAAGGRAGVAGADQRHQRSVEQPGVTLDDQQGRRVVDLSQRARVQPLSEHQVAGAERLHPRQLALCRFGRA
jgi:hypothetical protein